MMLSPDFEIKKVLIFVKYFSKLLKMTPNPKKYIFANFGNGKVLLSLNMSSLEKLG